MRRGRSRLDSTGISVSDAGGEITPVSVPEADPYGCELEDFARACAQLLEKLGAKVASLFREEPGQQVMDDLRHFKQVMHRVWEYCEARLAFTLAAFNVLVPWHGLPADKDGVVSLSIAEFSL